MAGFTFRGRVMLNNRGWLLKFFIPVGLFAALCVHAAWRMADHRPTITRCLADPDRYDGRHIWMPPTPVVEVHPEGFFIKDKGRAMRVISDRKPGTGRWVTARGTFHKPNTLKADLVSEHAYWAAQRGGAYGVSLTVLLGWLWYVRRRFRLGLKGGLIHRRREETKDQPVTLRG